MTASEPGPGQGVRAGVLVSFEGHWGCGKSTTAAAVSARLAAAGHTAQVLQSGGQTGIVGRLAQMLDAAPLRRRDGLGGFEAPHHATVDVLLRQCREAYQHRMVYRPALGQPGVVLLDHGVYLKLAYAVAVLAEQHPDRDPDELLAQVRRSAAVWFEHPDLAIWLDTPWPLARERAIGRGYGGGDPGSIERLRFLPRYDDALRRTAAAEPDRVRRIRVGARDTSDLLPEIDDLLAPFLSSPDTGASP